MITSTTQRNCYFCISKHILANNGNKYVRKCTTIYNLANSDWVILPMTATLIPDIVFYVWILYPIWSHKQGQCVCTLLTTQMMYGINTTSMGHALVVKTLWYNLHLDILFINVLFYVFCLFIHQIIVTHTPILMQNHYLFVLFRSCSRTPMPMSNCSRGGCCCYNCGAGYVFCCY